MCSFKLLTDAHIQTMFYALVHITLYVWYKNVVDDFRAINSENGEANKIKNQVTGEWGGVPDVARAYKVYLTIA